VTDPRIARLVLPHARLTLEFEASRQVVTLKDKKGFALLLEHSAESLPPSRVFYSQVDGVNETRRQLA